ncbi:GNAT family N-acetyltransferase [Brevundimonas sp.]|uniref:phosphatidylglycerol lysyltransferase domain-containing protein n=1 Tax=Brevundimonas sp. TaxID=1871086 RepID=UPI0025BC0D9E|nr:GNAT family N-acetyltransferase [Brevundimonas sp.]
MARRLGGLAYELTPQVFAVATFVAGALVLISAMTPAFVGRLTALGRWAPPLLIDLSHFAASVTGFVLLVLAAGLWRRRRGAYWAALAVLMGGAVFSLLKGLDWEEALELTAVAVLLAPCRGAFIRRSRLLEPLRPGWLLVLLAAVVALLWLGFFAYRDVAYTDDLWWRLVTDRQVSGFLRAAGGLAVLTLLAAGWSLLTAPGARSHGPAGPVELARARAALVSADRASPGAWLGLLGDKALMFSPSGRSFIAYRVRGRRWIALGEPVGLKSERRELLWSFAETADSYGAAAVFYSVGEGLLGDLATMGLAVRKVGESAVVPLGAFTLSGRSRQNLRTAVSRAEREGATFEVMPPGSAAANIDALKTVSDLWLRAHQGAEKTFSMGWFDPDHLDQGPLAVVRVEGRIVAFANLLVAGDELEVDLMRHRLDAPPGVMDYLFVRVMEWARDQGFRVLGLGAAPLAGLENRRMAPIFARVGALVFDEGGALYGFSGLRAYKAKFSPDWRPTFIAAPATTPLALALLDVALLTSGGWAGLLGLRR